MSLPRWLPVALLGAILAVAAVCLLFSTFMMYDDEGYVLFSLRQFAEGGGLYERVYSQYGPFLFLFHQALNVAGLEFTNVGGRLLALTSWLGATGFCAALVWRLTRSQAATVFTMGGVFLHLWPMISEPSHPGGFIVFSTAALAWLGVRWTAHPGRLAAAAGAIGAALLLTKINVGIFIFAGAGVWWLLHLDEKFLGPKGRTALAAVALALLPFALMHGQLELEWVRTFAIVAAAAGAAIVLAAAPGAGAATQWRNLGPAVIAALSVILLTAAGILAQGTSLSGLLEGVIFGPLRHPQAYTAFVKWRPGAVLLALISLALAAGMLARPSRVGAGIALAGRLVSALAFLVIWLFDWPINLHAFALSYGVTLAWLFVQPLDAERQTQPARTWLALLVVTQVLHAFPVAGSQISWGTFLWIPLAVVGVHDAGRVLAARRIPLWPGACRLAAGALILATTLRCAHYAWVGVTRVRDSDSLGLPGAASLRLPENFTTTLRLLARNATAHADMLFSLPGLHSFHLWTDLPPPTTHNATHWFTLLSPAQQAEIQERLAAAPRSCVIVQRSLYDFLQRSGVATESPLTVWLQANYEPAFALETYEFWVRKGRRIAALSTATAHEAQPGISPRFQVTLTLAEAALTQVAAIELARLDGEVSATVRTWTNAQTQVFVTPLNSAGIEAGPARQVTFPFDASGLMRIELRTDEFPAGFPTGHGVLYLRDATGRRLAEARFVQDLR